MTCSLVGDTVAEGGGAMTAQPESGPTVRRMLVGARLRRLREGKGISREDAGWAIRGSESKISRMELGRVGFKLRDIADLLTLYGVESEHERKILLAMAREANQPGWWHEYGDLLPSWLQSYLDLEAAASLIRTYELQFVPGLLQTEAYARAVIELGHSRAKPDEIDRRVSVRMSRRQLLTRQGAPLLWVVIDEAVLRRPIGGRNVLRGQIEALVEAHAMRNVRLQILPFAVGGHAATGGAFTILRFAEGDLPDVVYVESLTSAHYIERPEEVDQYSLAAARLFVEAEPPDSTPMLLRRAIEDLG
jgi:transcriptional regulator with XRE-family HTH domain